MVKRPPLKRVYVVAGTLREFLNWERENRLGPYMEAVYVASAQQMRGLENPTVLYYGTWRQREDAFYIEQVVLAQMRPT